ncbi:2-polyprenylphenol 6-hydroxylase [Gymnodinialimonas hymeniacidonis]|uniref:2-polyprenylphenol 6-hydroxylase n=1 Tax=Gymnodinialimonas hymeniacidonis TaxID=3126508 RepID=UPI0034C614B9
MRGPHNIWRLARTGATFERTGAMGAVLEAMEAPRAIRIAARVLGWPLKWFGLRGDPSMPPVPRALQALGPAYIKFGQILSTRPDVVGPEMALELQVLQDKLPPFPTTDARRVVAEELGQPLEAVFSDFSEPVAAASIAQVHRATLKESGRDVAVKILRPGIDRAFRKDVDAFHLMATLIETLSPSSRRLRPRDVIDHFEGVVLQELDLRIEASAAGEFFANTEADEGFVVPKVEWGMSSRRMMVLGWADGLPLSDLDAINAAGHDKVGLARTALQMFLRHALRDGYFHADMHQGNLKVAPNGDLVALDFGIMGRLDEYTRRVYAEILMGFIRKDYRRVAEVHFEAGYVPADRDVAEFAQALRSVGEPIFGMEASKISMGRLLAFLFEVTERFGMETRTELILLQRTMVVVEGVGRSLDPDLNIWAAARPVVEEYIARNIGPQAVARDLWRTALVLSRFGPRLPQLAEAALIAQAHPERPKRENRWPERVLLGGGGLALGLAAALIWAAF